MMTYHDLLMQLWWCWCWSMMTKVVRQRWSIMMIDAVDRWSMIDGRLSMVMLDDNDVWWWPMLTVDGDQWLCWLMVIIDYDDGDRWRCWLVMMIDDDVWWWPMLTVDGDRWWCWLMMTIDDVRWLTTLLTTSDDDRCWRSCAFTGELILDSCSFTVRDANAQNSCHSAFAAGE